MSELRVGNAVEDWESQFLPAIVDTNGSTGPVVRHPEWFVARHTFPNLTLMVRIFRDIGLEHHFFTYEFARPRSKPTTRSWLPGYVFLSFDPYLDRWQQVVRIPGVKEILGGPRPRPLPPVGWGSMDDLRARLQPTLPKNTAATSIASGTEVRIKNGAFRGHTAKVAESDRRHAKVIMMLFGHPSEVKVSIRDLEIVG